MPSPFPGMDPYLEGPDWPDFHATFIVCWRDALKRELPPGYRARVDERVNLIEVDPDSQRLVRPDVAVEQQPTGIGAPPRSGSASVATLEPISVPLPQLVEVRETRIEIVGRTDDALVAVLELLSPYNKAPGAGQAEYLAKRLSVLRQPVHLVELDLLRGGRRLPMGSPLPEGDYYAMVSRADRRPNCDVYVWGLRDVLPIVPVPLRGAETDVRVSLADVFARAFEMGGYGAEIDYARPPHLPLSAADQAWIETRSKSVPR